MNIQILYNWKPLSISKTALHTRTHRNKLFESMRLLIYYDNGKIEESQMHRSLTVCKNNHP